MTPEAARRFIQRNLRLAPVPDLPAIRLYTAHAASRLGRLASGDAPPYWAWPWAGGLVLAMHLAAHPDSVAGLRVLDLGAGSGLVGIAAMRAGAAAATASESDTMAREAIALNAGANEVLIDIAGDVTQAPPLAVDVILAGDVFYAPEVAARMIAYLGACAAAGITILVGDPGRRDLPLERLHLLAKHDVRDVGGSVASAGVYRFLP